MNTAKTVNGVRVINEAYVSQIIECHEHLTITQKDNSVIVKHNPQMIIVSVDRHPNAQVNLYEALSLMRIALIEMIGSPIYRQENNNVHVIIKRTKRNAHINGAK